LIIRVTIVKAVVGAPVWIDRIVNLRRRPCVEPNALVDASRRRTQIKHIMVKPSVATVVANPIAGMSDAWMFGPEEKILAEAKIVPN
jgi:hypothetical protein